MDKKLINENEQDSVIYLSKISVVLDKKIYKLSVDTN